MSRIRTVLSDVLDVRQLREWVSAYLVRRERSLARQLRVARALTVRGRVGGAPGRGEVWAVGTVRDEADVVAVVVRHLLRQGVDRVVVSDHGSVDGTREILDALAREDPRIVVVDDRATGHFQMEKITALAHLAWRHGASWVVPFDADEIWFAEGTRLADFLRSSPDAVVSARVLNAVPHVDGGARLREDATFAVETASSFAPKVAFRAHPLVLVGPGNHGVNRAGAHSHGLVVVHVPYRGEAQVARKFRQGAQAIAATGDSSDVAWHWRAGAAMSSAQIAAAWQRIVAGDAVPDVGWAGGTFRPDQVLLRECWPKDR